MRRLLCLGMAIALAAFAQQKIGTVNAETPEGQLLQQIGQEQDPAKKLGMLEKFAADFGKHEAAGWVYSQLQEGYLKAGQPDKALEWGEKLAARDPDDLSAAHQNLKAAEARKDPDAVKKWSNLTSQLAVKVAASTKPADEDEVEHWKARVDFAKQVNTYTEYSLYAMALQITDPAKRVELAEALLQRSPQSEYMKKLAGVEFAALRQLNDNARAMAVAERVLATDQTNEDMLIFAANQYMEQKRDPDKVIAYSAKVVELMNTKPKPEGVSDAEWEVKKTTLTGLAHFFAGSTYFNEKKYKEADAELRTAIPQVGGNEQLKAAVLFYAGLNANSLGNKNDALLFNTQCAAIKSQFQGQAMKNATVLRSQGAVMPSSAKPAPKKKK
jgi:tetratricopeptide (TPR) repeat protein